MYNYLISIHAPTRGATLLPSLASRIPDISIHAPTRGATEEHQCKPAQKHYFNPRSHEGSDPNFQLFFQNLFAFQSTLPRGERPRCSCGCLLCGKISIHAPTRGATVSTCSLSTRYSNFNPRSHEGSDSD